MKELLLVFQTLDMNHPRARRCVEHLKKTDLSMAELFIVDVAYGEDFNRGQYLEGFKKLADGRPLVLLSDDVLIEDVRWLTKLRAIAANSDVLVVGCQQYAEGSGVKFVGAIIAADGAYERPPERPSERPIFEQLTDLPAGMQSPLYVPVVADGVVFIAQPDKIHFDAAYRGSLCDADVCMQAWSMGKKTATSLDISIKRMTSPTAPDNSGDRDIFVHKWQKFINTSLYTVQELKWLEKYLKKNNEAMI
ncbi:MAG: hypothetical protein HQL05_02905 [Nitrospirae bacterium]|uniref:hypothetical protein n=1 Tax=Candidatus Magnetobacterium casense TaxID=1455061 RepID=UPI00058DBB09|nr:hypothetical protein [Candidatus Magnetobacterium casensis]MBF0336757.1 hypothetical protein [Nitrospirota bacterium]